MDNNNTKEFQIISLNFENIKTPTLTEVRGGKYVKFGDDNKYPQFLEELYNSSPKHASIINNKCKYIYGQGIKSKDENQAAELFIKLTKNLQKGIIADIEMFGGFYLEAIPKKNNKGWVFSKLNFSKVRSNASNTKFYYKKKWGDGRTDFDKEWPAFDPDVLVPSIIFFKEQRIGVETYSLPSYFSAVNYIAADAEIAKHTFNNSQNGFSATKMVTFRNGKPPREKKHEVTYEMEQAFSGAKGKKFIITFQDPGQDDTLPKIDDLGASDLTKENFSQIDDLISSNIYAAHEVTSPELMGVPSRNNMSSGEGEKLRVSYELFKNVYATAKQMQVCEIFEFLAYLNGIQAEYTIQPLEAVTKSFSEQTFQNNLTKAEIRNILGFPEEIEVEGNQKLVNSINTLSPLVANKVLETMTKDEIRSIAGLSQIAGGSLIDSQGNEISPVQLNKELNNVNTVLTNLTGRQRQNVMSIVRQFSSGKLTKPQASILLKSGYGFSDSEVNDFLGIDDDPATNDSKELLFESEEEVAQVFASFGETMDNYTKVESYPATFDEEEEASILKQITKIKTKIPKFEVRYSYEKRLEASGPVILETSRPFCKKMIALNRFYTREDIQKISQIVGYDVFNRTGGFWNDNGKVKKHCRHEFRSNVVIKKN